MNREEAINIFNKKLKWYKHDQNNPLLNCIKDDFESVIDEIYNEINQLKNENARLKKQLANNHNIECMCSFCKPPISCCYVENE